MLNVLDNHTDCFSSDGFYVYGHTVFFFKWRWVKKAAASTTKSIIHTDEEERMILSSIILLMIQKYLLY